MTYSVHLETGGDEGDPFATFRSSAEDTLGAVGGAVGSMASGKDDPVGDESLRNDEHMIKIMTWMWHCKRNVTMRYSYL